jgi:low temperature requirement protein LtrA
VSHGVGRSRLLSPPRIRTLEGDDDGRHATWLELFFDLVFVVAAAQLAGALSNDLTLHGFLVFCGLFVPVWWAWVGYTFYADRFDTDDLVHRLLMLGGMFAVGALASVIPDAARGDTAPFAIAYVAVRFFVIALNARAWLHLPAARPLLNVYVPAFSLAAALMLVSVAVEPPARYWLWAVALAIDVGTPLTVRRRIEVVPIHASHIPERVGLFTIIVLGETVVAVVIGTSTVDWSLETGVVAALGFVVGAGFWWVYFDYLDGETLLGRGTWVGQTYLYSHLPLTAGIVALGIGVEHAIEETAGTDLRDGTRWLLCGGLALAFGSLAAIHRAAAGARRDVDVRLRLSVVGVALAVALLGGGLDPLPAMAILAASVAACLALELGLHHRHASVAEAPPSAEAFVP